MVWPAYWIRVKGRHLYVGTAHEGTTEDPERFLAIIRGSESLAKLKECYPARRSSLLRALEQLGYDFAALLQRQMRDGLTNAELARLHALDAKWIACRRSEWVIPGLTGRPCKQTNDLEMFDAYARHGSYAGAARELGVDPRTFGARYRAAKARSK